MELDLKKIYRRVSGSLDLSVTSGKIYPISVSRRGNFVVENEEGHVSVWTPELFWKYFEEYREPVELWIREWDDGGFGVIHPDNLPLPAPKSEVRRFRVKEVVE